MASSINYWSGFKYKNIYLSLGLICLGLTLAYIGPSNLNEPIILSFFLLATSFSLILIGVYNWKDVPGQSIFEKIALYSYGLYLWNNLIEKLISKFFQNYSPFVKISFFFIGSILISICTYYLVEKPFMKMRSRVLIKLNAAKSS
jgi:peptidoglycan/LPS O-acetylase OafA/YrhL